MYAQLNDSLLDIKVIIFNNIGGLMSKNKIYGLNFLRIISMLGIIGLHILNNGGAFPKENLLSLYEFPISIIYILCATSVNTFAMLTGYLYVDKINVKYKNILKLLFTVLFYSAIITILFLIFKRDVFYSIFDIIKSLIPPLADKYWYITCYVLLFVIIPFINKLINSLTISQFKLLLILLILFTSVLPTFLLTDFFRLDYGYSTAWLIVCYFIGAYIKRSNQKVSSRIICLLYILCVIVIMGISIVGLLFMKSSSVYNVLVAYTSPFIVILSVFLILLFSNVQFKNMFLIKLIDSLSGSAFDVYIIHSHLLIFEWILKGNFVFIKDLPFLVAIPAIIFSIIAIYGVCWGISNLKALVFKFVRIDFVFDELGYKVDCWLDKMGNGTRDQTV